jgi:DUF971 family protein
MQKPSTDPQHVAIAKSAGIQIDWSDGHHSDFSNAFLRDHCPCATCTGAHGSPPQQPQAQNPFQMYRPVLKMEALEPVGNYALQIRWNDGHAAGIYCYEYLRGICPCALCQPANAG